MVVSLLSSSKIGANIMVVPPLPSSQIRANIMGVSPLSSIQTAANIMVVSPLSSSQIEANIMAVPEIDYWKRLKHRRAYMDGGRIYSYTSHEHLNTPKTTQILSSPKA